MNPPGGPVTSDSHGRVFGLDLLRAAAILMVVYAHAFVVLYPHFGEPLGYFGHGGFYGVELFFVLSGFLIGQILIRTGADFARAGNVAFFYVRRWFRTLPLFFLFLFVNVIFERSFRAHAVGFNEALSHGLFLRNLTGLHLTFFPESWSLAIEEWFYLLFPAALWFGLKLTRRFGAVFLVAAFTFLAFSTIARLITGLDPSASWPTQIRMSVIYRFDALMIGMLGAWLALRFPKAWVRSPILVAFSGLILLVVTYTTLWKIQNGHLQFGDDSYFARTFRFTLISLGYALLLPWASGWKLARENFASKAVRKIALWSYSLYLVHLPFFVLVGQAGLGADQPMPVGKALFSFALQICGAILLSALLYRFFEAPCTRLREKAAPAVARIFGSPS